MLRRLVVLAALFAVSCGDGSAVTTVDAEPTRLLSLGDSYTIGESVPEPQRWPNQLAVALESEGISVGSVEIVARTGWTTSELDAGIDASGPSGPYDLVTLLIGVNNQFRGLSTDEYRSEFADLLERAVGFAGGASEKVVVLSIPDWGVTPFASGYDADRIAEEIDAFNAVAEDEAQRRGVAFVDVTGISRSGAAALVADDGLHPSGEQYRRWVEVILPFAVGVLG